MLGLDAKFLYSETSTAHMHTLKVAVLDLSKLPAGLSFDDLIGGIGHQLHRLPQFRRRTVPVPLGLGHPVWVEDPHFDLARHVTRRRALPPGGPRQLAAVVAQVAGTPLPRDRPLWEMVVVEGLADHQVAVVAKIHHALADGAAAVALLRNVVMGAAEDDPGAEDPWRPEAIPNRRQLLRLAAREHLTRLEGIPRLLARSVRGLRDSQARRRTMAVKPPLPFETPRTSLNVSLDAGRTYAMTTLPLEALKSIRRDQGTTLNDVYLAVCAGALRDRLLAAGELPDRSLVAGVPVSTDPDLLRMEGNRVDNLYVAIGTHIADPLERLRSIAAETRASKEVRSVFGNDLLEQRAAVVPPQLYALTVRTWGLTRLANHLRPPLNVILSNVPGPRDPLAFGDTPLEAIYSVGPILEGIGLNITAWSYVDALHVSVLGCPASLPDPWPLVESLQVALDELLAASAAATPTPEAAPVAEATGPD